MYNAIKTQLAEVLGLTKDALHIHMGLALFFAVALVLRRSPASLVPWIAVLIFETVNELLDIFHWHDGAFAVDLGDAPKDFLNTMLWPTIVVIAFRLTAPRREERRQH